MKKFLAAIGLTIIMTIDATAGIRWLETVHDFGAFDENDGKVSCQFRFVNEGPENVAIRAARASCGCTTPSFTKNTIEPGDTGVVSATYNPAGRPGRFSKKVTVDFTGITDHPSLIIKGVVIGSSNTLRSRYPVEAGQLKFRSTIVPFGTILKGRAKSAFLEVYNASKEPVTPKWTDVPAYLRIHGVPDTIPPGEQGTYSFVLTPADTDLYGILTDSVNIAIAGEAPVKIEITAILEEDFSRLTPGQREKAPVISLPENRIDFGQFAADGEPLKQTFEIANRGKSDLLIRRVYTLDPGITVKVPSGKVKKGKKVTGTIIVDPRKLPSPLLNARIQIISNDPDTPLTILRAVGIPE